VDRRAAVHAEGAWLMPDINLTGEITLPLLAGFAGLVLVVTVCLVILLAVLHVTDRELQVTLRPMFFGTTARKPAPAADRHVEKMYNAALKRLDDLEQALVSIAEADVAELERVTGDWLDFVCEGLATVLSAGNNAHFRVAIWTDDEGDRDYIKGLAYFGFNRHDVKYEKLPRGTTLAGWVIANREDHYAPDLDLCMLFRPRSSKPRYKSMYAAPLGSEGDPWAAITVDAPAPDGLSEERRALIRRFGSLASVGARVARGRMSGPTGTIDPDVRAATWS
jgi:hypothetical protein